jgi:hypothetical protein
MWLVALAAFFLLFVPPGEAWAQRTCDQYRAAITSIPVATPTERVPGVANKRIYLCGYIIMPDSAAAGQSVEFELTSGTGTNCATNKITMIPRMRVPPNGIVNRVAFASGEITAPGAAVCVQTWGSGSLTSIFYWAQF